MFQSMSNAFALLKSRRDKREADRRRLVRKIVEDDKILPAEILEKIDELGVDPETLFQEAHTESLRRELSNLAAQIPKLRAALDSAKADRLATIHRMRGERLAQQEAHRAANAATLAAVGQAADALERAERAAVVLREMSSCQLSPIEA